MIAYLTAHWRRYWHVLWGTLGDPHVPHRMLTARELGSARVVRLACTCGQVFWEPTA